MYTPAAQRLGQIHFLHLAWKACRRHTSKWLQTSVSAVYGSSITVQCTQSQKPRRKGHKGCGRVFQCSCSKYYNNNKQVCVCVYGNLLHIRKKCRCVCVWEREQHLLSCYLGGFLSDIYIHAPLRLPVCVRKRQRRRESFYSPYHPSWSQTNCRRDGGQLVLTRRAHTHTHLVRQDKSQTTPGHTWA